ncbi:MAG TPA: hypothetical protein VGI57_15770 [Usitatibacter sp.]
MLRLAFAIALSAASGLSLAATEIEGTWKYSELDATVQIRLKRGGECSMVAGTSQSTGAIIAECTYTLQRPYVYVFLKGTSGHHPIRLDLLADDHLMRIEGETWRTLHRVDEPPAYPSPIDLDKPGALSDLEERNPAGYAKVVKLIGIMQKHGCRGVWRGEIDALVRWDFMECPSTRNSSETTRIAFWLGDTRYLISFPPT